MAEHGVRVQAAGGEPIEGDGVALAVGHTPGKPVVELDSPRHVSDPWAPRALDAVSGDDPVVIVGSGLTMVDVVLVLASRGHTASVRVLSRHGLLPVAHAASAPRLTPLPRPGGRAPDLHAWLRWARTRRAQDPDGDWRSVVDALRPVTPALWRSLSVSDRRRFLRHLGARWSVVRHRMPESCAATIDGLLGEGRLVVERARQIRAREDGDAVEVSWRGADSAERVERAGWLVDATGPAQDLASARRRAPLLDQLLRDGYARPDPLGLGIDATPEGSLVDTLGRPSRRLFALGPLLRATLWESTAIPEIRVQAEALAREWLDRGARRDAPQRPAIRPTSA